MCCVKVKPLTSAGLMLCLEDTGVQWQLRDCCESAQSFTGKLPIAEKLENKSSVVTFNYFQFKQQQKS